MSTPVPEATVARLPIYLRSLRELAEMGVKTVSSKRLAELSGVNAARVRKDLSYLGSYGVRGVGYEVRYLIFQTSRELGLTGDRGIVIAGAGHLGQALANYPGFAQKGCRICAMVDVDPEKVGSELGGVPVVGPDRVPEVMDRNPGAIVVVATPAAVAQEVVDRFVAAGAHSILNFAPVVLSVPEGVAVRQVDMALELQVLSFYAEQGERSASARRVQSVGS